MLLKFFKRGGSDDNRRTLGGSAVKTYLLGTDEKPRENARLLLGDPEANTEIINGLKFAKVYTSGCLSFREDEQITEAQKYAIIEDFEKMVFVGLESHQFTSYWVEHTDKGRLELNFVFPNVELTSGKSLQVYYHPRDKNLVNAWKNLCNDTYGLVNPEDLENRRDVTPSIGSNILRHWQHSNQPTLLEKFQRYQSMEDFKTDLATVVLTEVEKKLQQGQSVTSQDEVAGILMGLGFEISRQSKDSISIKNPDPSKKNIKLKGLIYERDVKADTIAYMANRKNDFMSSATKVFEAAFEGAFEVEDKAERHRNAQETFTTELGKRRQRHLQRYQLPESEIEFVLPKSHDSESMDLDKQGLNLQLTLNTVTDLVQPNLPSFKNYQWQSASIHQLPLFISSDIRVLYDTHRRQLHQPTTAYRQLDKLINKPREKNRHNASADSERTASSNRPSPFGFNTDVVSTAITNYRRGNRKTKSTDVESGRELLNRIENHQQRASQNAQTRQTRVSNLTREDDSDLESAEPSITVRRKRHRYVVERVAEFNNAMSDIVSNHDERTSRIKPVSRRLRKLKDGYENNARQLKATTDDYGKLATAISTFATAVIEFFKGLYAGLRKKALGYAGEGLLHVRNSADSQERQATTAEVTSHIDSHPYNLAGYMSLELTVQNWEKQKKENEKVNELKFRGFGM